MGSRKQEPSETKKIKQDISPAFSRRNFLRRTSIGAGALAIASCSPFQSNVGTNPDDQVQLVYQDWRTDWFPSLAKRMLEVFSETHPNIHVFFTPDPENLTEQMELDFRNGSAPDVLAGCCDFLPQWAQQGYLLDLRPFIDADLNQILIDDWDSAQYNALALSNGQQFGLPKYHGSLALYYNKDLFDRNEVEYPDHSWNIGDYSSAMEIFYKAALSPGKRPFWGSMLDISWERLQVHANGRGGHFVNPLDDTKSLMGSEETLAAMEWIRSEMWEKQHLAVPRDVGNLSTRDAFSMGMLAMVEDGSWALKDILEKSDFRIGVAPFPSGPDRKVTLATTDGFAIYAGTRYPEAAWELLKFLVSLDYGKELARAHLLQPARASLQEEWIDIVRRQYLEKTREMDIAAFTEGHLQGYSVTAEIFRNMAEARKLAKGAFQKIFTFGTADVQILREVSQDIEKSQQGS